MECVLVNDRLWTWVTGNMDGIACRNNSCGYRKTGKGSFWLRSISGGDNRQWHGFLLGTPPSNAWKVENKNYRAAYRPVGNKRVEWHHQTVKVMVERREISTFCHNMVSKVGERGETVPQRSIFTYEWRHPQKTSLISMRRGRQKYRLVKRFGWNRQTSSIQHNGEEGW